MRELLVVSYSRWKKLLSNYGRRRYYVSPFSTEGIMMKKGEMKRIFCLGLTVAILMLGGGTIHADNRLFTSSSLVSAHETTSSNYAEKKKSGSWYLYNKKKQSYMTGLQKLADGRICYYNQQGKRVSGWHRVQQERYYFDNKTGAMAQATILKIKGQTYAFNSQGKATNMEKVNEMLRDLGSYLTVGVQSQKSGQIYQASNFTGRRLQTASTVKVAVLAELLHQTGGDLTAEQKNLAQRMIENSDNEATITILNTYLDGESNGANTLYRDLHMSETTSGEIFGKTLTTPRDQLKLLREIYLTGHSSYLNSKSQTYIQELMANVSQGQNWGISAGNDQYYLKNGWVTREGQNNWYINSIGFIPNHGSGYIIAIYSYNNTMNSGIAKVEQISRLIAEILK